MKQLIHYIKIITGDIRTIVNSDKVKHTKVPFDPKATKFKVTLPPERPDFNAWSKYIHTQIR